RWGYYPCPFEVYRMLKELNRRCLEARRRKGAWERWYRKAPHNRPGPEPALDATFCRKVTLPSGRTVVQFDDRRVEDAYRQARHPKPTAEEVEHAILNEDEVRRLLAAGEAA